MLQVNMETGKVVKHPAMQQVREDEVFFLRSRVAELKAELANARTRIDFLKEALDSAYAETFEHKNSIKYLRNLLFRLSQAVLAGETGQAEELAHRAMEVCS